MIESKIAKTHTYNNRFIHILHENVAGRRQGTKHKQKQMRVSSGYQEI